MGMSGPAECAGLFPLSPALFPLVLAFLVAIACWFHCFPGCFYLFFVFFCFFKSPFLAFFFQSLCFCFFFKAFFLLFKIVFFCFFAFFRFFKKTRFTGVSLYSRQHNASDDSRHDGDGAEAQWFGGPEKHGELLGNPLFKWSANWENSL